LGLDGFRAIPHDDDYRMDVAALRQAITEDLQKGFRPLAVIATVGTTSTTSVDPVAEIAQVCADENLWLHIDAAYAGSAALCPEYRWCLEGCELADSFVFNPHKWLLVPIDASALYTRHPEIFKRAFSLVPEYLTTPMTGEVVDLMDYGVQLGRRFRALKVWWVLRSYGLSGLQTHLRRHIEMAQAFSIWVDEQPLLERAAPAPFSVICFRALPPGMEQGEALDGFNMRLMEEINLSGDVYLSHTRLDDGIALRVAIGNIGTDETDLDRCRTLILKGLQCLSNL